MREGKDTMEDTETSSGSEEPPEGVRPSQVHGPGGASLVVLESAGQPLGNHWCTC